MNNQSLSKGQALRGLYLLTLLEGLAFIIFITVDETIVPILFIQGITTLIVGLIGLIAYAKPEQVKISLTRGLFCGLITAAIASLIVFIQLLYYALSPDYILTGIGKLIFAWSLINLLLMIATAVFQKKHSSLLQQGVVYQMNNYPVNDGQQPYNRYG